MHTLNVATRKFGRLSTVLWLHVASDPLPQEWALGIDATVRALEDLGGDLTRLRSLVVSDGGAPNARQRKDLAERVFRQHPSQLAVLTNVLSNPVKRGIVTAINWLNPAFRAVPVVEWRAALNHLDLDAHAVPIVEELQGLQRDLPRVAALAQFAREVETAQSR